MMIVKLICNECHKITYAKDDNIECIWCESDNVGIEDKEENQRH